MKLMSVKPCVYVAETATGWEVFVAPVFDDVSRYMSFDDLGYARAYATGLHLGGEYTLVDFPGGTTIERPCGGDA
jgi:hypothetical protein